MDCRSSSPFMHETDALNEDVMSQHKEINNIVS